MERNWGQVEGLWMGRRGMREREVEIVGGVIGFEVEGVDEHGSPGS